tara:strand:- start:38 stop:331 length:294 start_codon:yes stop_codon:yes gene_type:complete
MNKLTNEEYKMKRELQTKFVNVVMDLIGNEISVLSAYVYADKYMDYFGVNATKSYMEVYKKAMKLNKTLPSEIKSTLMHDLMLTRAERPELCVPRTA